MNQFSEIFKDGKKLNIWGFFAIESERFFNENGEFDDSFFTKMSGESIQVDDKGVKKILCGKFIPEIPYILGIGKKSDNVEYQMKNGPYAAFFYKDGNLRLFTNGYEHKIGKEKNIKKVFGGYNIVIQTKDESVFFIGYNSYFPPS